ncbi:two-partner secretion domain-containing protein [Variovorax ginsengisoli]|uniref:Filamentous hemagglutinin family protein n=1 Tax=Variovorax ginsengisoli TaxID=363844 RepID=A0ABT9S4T0_9BURK|nr:filamentous hemagglutinin N-terminal domain-containing protein [Variovorax ginsengisoli]MDP9898771.1 filamentous hemagglutinin family protein [Variovorax ginsengisoli]
MNKNFHRVIFNAARGVRMVVQETAKSAGKATSGSTGAVVNVAAIAGALMSAPLHAQIVADPKAPGSQRPTVLVAPNGVPLVNIQTPSAAGVSRNVYRQFDVNSNGVILNNSRTNVQTQLGGFVQGNPWMSAGSARVIVNEVNSANPSYLRGFVEVAGPRSEVVIANPSGIQVDGGGFINVNRATLTTGTPQYGASGSLDSYVVRGGTIGISGSGLDASSTESLSILSRAFELSGALHATDLTVVAGANQVAADLSGITPIAGNGSAPSYAIDVAQLGGMYSNHIALIVNEQGVGARNTGTIQTSTGSYTLAGAGKLTLSADGVLENSGLIQTSSDADIRVAGLANSGTIQSGASLAVATQSDLANQIGGTGGTLEGQRVELSSAAGNIDNRGGTIRQTSAAALTVTGPNLSNTNAGFIGAEPVAASGSGSSGSSGSGSTSSGSGASESSGASGGTSGTTTGGSTGGSTTTPAVVSPGSLTAAGSILNDGGKLYAGGDIALQTPNVNNDGGTLNVASMALSGPSFSNAGGTLNVSNTFTANVGTLNNTGGSLSAGSIAIVTTGDLNNQGGTLASDSAVDVTVGGAADNSNGTVSAVGALNATVSGALDNTSGKLLGNTTVTVAAGALNNTQGSVQSSSGTTQLVVTHQLLNDKGSIGAGTDLSVQAGSLANTGTLRAERDSTVTVASALTNDGSVTAGGNTTVSAGSLTGNSNGVLGAGIKADGTLGSAGDLTITTTGSLQAAGTVLAAGNIAAQGASTDLSGSKTSGANIALTAASGDVTTSHATVTTMGTLSVTANTSTSQSLVNDAGELSAGQLDLHASNIQNTNAGQIVQTGTGQTAIAVTGTLAARERLDIATDTLTDQDGALILSLGDMAVGGSLDANRHAMGQANVLTNKAATLQATGNMTIGAGTLNNLNGGVSYPGKRKLILSA